MKLNLMHVLQALTNIYTQATIMSISLAWQMTRKLKERTMRAGLDNAPTAPSHPAAWWEGRSS